MTLHAHIKNWLRDKHALDTAQAKAVIAIAQADRELQRFRKWWSLDAGCVAVTRNLLNIESRTHQLATAYKNHLVEPQLI
jgi:hypothetical protein